jgi:integrase
MSAFRSALEDYLALRRSLGHELADAARLLPRFVEHLEAKGAEFITVEAALAWSVQPDAGPGSTVRGRRMSAVRGFARFMTGVDPRTEVPPAGLVPLRSRWRPPFIYRDEDVAALMAEARRSIREPLRAATYETLVGLLAATGLRIGEALRLDRGELDWLERVLIVRRSKFGKSRRVPLTPSTLEALEAYAGTRDDLLPMPTTMAFFVSLRGTRLIHEVVQLAFRRLCDATGVGAGAARPPRLHDLRHSFAVHSLLDWYREGLDVEARIPWLSTYLGHQDPISTYWYLSAAPELLAYAAGRLGSFPAVTP